jgi:SAM-dependent methyltransferase
MRRRLVRWTDSSDAGRRLRRALISNPVTGPAISALDRRRMRRLARRGDPVARSKSRWREAPPSRGLTWGEEVSGEAAASAAAEHGVFGPGRSVLEIGPGYGRILGACLDAGLEFDRYLGLDLSERNVEHLRGSFDDPRVEFRQGDAETAQLGDPVDGVMSFLVFKHLYPSFEPTLANLAPQLADGATVLFDLLEGSRAYFHADGATYIRHYTREEARALVERAGLELGGFGRVEHAPGRERLLVIARRSR